MTDVKENDNIVVWFSNGAASAIAWEMTLKKYGDFANVVAVNNPIAEEHEDNIRFGNDVANWLGRELVRWVNPKYPNGSCVDVWNDRKAMSFPKGAPCTQELKKFARLDYEKNHKVDWHVLGFTADEKHRYDRFVLTERSNVIPILIESNFSKQACMDRLVNAGISPPKVYSMGFPNANCIGCVKATSPTYWNLVRDVAPNVFNERSIQSRLIGARLARYNGKRVFLDELPIDAKGNSLKTMNVECGIFCEERG